MLHGAAVTGLCLRSQGLRFLFPKQAFAPEGREDETWPEAAASCQTGAESNFMPLCSPWKFEFYSVLLLKR